MYKNRTVAVVMPAFNENSLIAKAVTSVPEFVDRIIVVEDGSSDGTAQRLVELAADDARVVIVQHSENQGLGQSLIDGYLKALEFEAELIAVMAGDAQMDPADLPVLLDPLESGRADYAKGNRLLHGEIGAMPRYRYFGNAVLTILTKFATGYYRVMDPQCGYTAITRSALARIPIGDMTTGYGYNADILNMLNISSFNVADVEVRPVYGEEKSTIRLRSYVPRTSWLLVRLFARRLWRRYVVRDFHPLVLFYLFGAVNLLFFATPLAMRLVFLYVRNGVVPSTTLVLVALTSLIGFQAILHAIWMDMDYNRSLWQ